MDIDAYFKAFSHLKGLSVKTTRQKAILLLGIIDMFANGEIETNEIRFDSRLEASFEKEWKRFVGRGSFGSHDAAKAFWYMYDEPFWHVITKHHSDDILQLMDDPNIMLSRSKLADSVDYATFDIDLYFLMTLSSSRMELRRVLLSSYINLSDEQIENAVQEDDDQEEIPDPQQLFDSLKADKGEAQNVLMGDETNGNEAYAQLSIDEKIEVNLSYFSFLKKNRLDRDTFLQHFPSVMKLCESISERSITSENVCPLFASTYSSFLTDLKFSLMSLPNATVLIDQIDAAINVLDNPSNSIDLYEEDSSAVDTISQEKDDWSTVTNEPIKPIKPETIISNNDNSHKEWTVKEESIALIMHRDGATEMEIAMRLGRTSMEVKEYFDGHQDEIAELQKNSIIDIESKTKSVSDSVAITPVSANGPQTNLMDQEPTSESEADSQLIVENRKNKCYISDSRGRRVYSSTGYAKIINGQPYRLSMTYSSFTINFIEERRANSYITGDRIIKASSKSDLFKALDTYFDIDSFETIRYVVRDNAWYVLVDHKWYNSDGSLLNGEPDGAIVGLDFDEVKKASNEEIQEDKSEETQEDDIEDDQEDNIEELEVEKVIPKDILWTYTPKGKIKRIRDIAQTPYDYLLMLAIVDIFTSNASNGSAMTFDELSAMMIANAWEIEGLEPGIIGKDALLDRCISYLIDESKENMAKPLDIHSPRKLIFKQIKDYPMSGAYEEAADKLMEKAPFEVVNTWLKANDVMELISRSQAFEDACLYAIYINKRESLIEINPSWKKGLFLESANLHAYFSALYAEYHEDLT